jgi:hypothetical protein
MSALSYLLLKTKTSSIQESILSQSRNIAFALQTGVEKKNNLAIQEFLISFGENNKNSALKEISVIAPEGYYYGSTERRLLGSDISSGLKKLLDNYQNIIPLQQIQIGEQAQYQSLIPIKTSGTNQVWFLRNIFDKNVFDTEFHNFRLLLVFISVLTVILTFLFTYLFCYFLLTQKLADLNYQIINILKQKAPQKILPFFKEIGQVSKSFLAVHKVMKEQSKHISELEEELNNPLTKKITEKKFNGNYLCVLIQLDYSLLSNGVEPSLKEFLLEVFHLITKNTKEQRVDLVNFGNYFFLTLDTKRFFSMGIQSIKNIEKKIHTNVVQFQKFGVKDLTCSMAIHFGKIFSIDIQEQGIKNNIYYGNSNYILQNLIKNAKPKEILFTQSLIPFLSEREEYTDIDFEVSCFGERQKIYLFGKAGIRAKKEKKIATTAAPAVGENELSVNTMLEETLRQ